ncbi:hypothetical protein OG542_03350 [Streptomyces violaceus]
MAAMKPTATPVSTSRGGVEAGPT